jgi:hypothetical protein
MSRMARLRLPKTFQYCAWPDAPNYIESALVAAMKRSATTPGADNRHSVFNRPYRDHLESLSIIPAEWIVRLP